MLAGDIVNNSDRNRAYDAAHAAMSHLSGWGGPKRQWIRQRTFAPMGLASIRNLPGPFMRRSVIIEKVPV
jgi:hypothetical protein